MTARRNSVIISGNSIKAEVGFRNELRAGTAATDRIPCVLITISEPTNEDLIRLIADCSKLLNNRRQRGEA